MAHPHPYQVDGEVGRFCFTTHALRQGERTCYPTNRWWLSPLQANEWYRTRGFKELAVEHGVIVQSYRKTCAWLNRLRHQPAAEGTRLRTLCDTSEAEGQQVLAQLEQQAAQVLKDHHFTPEGRPEESQAAIPWGQAATVLPAAAVAQAMAHCEVEERWKADMAANPVPYEAPASQVYVAIDPVGVKEQKAQRGQPSSAKADRCHPPHYVHTTVAHIDHDDEGYLLLHPHTGGLLRWLVAFLLHNGLWNQGLVFLTDGQKTLQAAILGAFAWWGSVQLLLDWYHLEKKCKEQLSLAMKGRELRNAALQEVRRLLWHGLTDRAIQFLQQLDPETIKLPAARDQLIASLQRNHAYIPCYAIRQTLGLRNSSNRGEKANDQVVSQRQKHNGMSWSPEGSVALAALTALIRNQEQDAWFRQKTIPFELKLAA